MDLTALEQGQFLSFKTADLASIKDHTAGVYTVWRGEDFVYVGIGGTKVTGPALAGEQTYAGLAGRLRSHGTGYRSGDKFCIYVVDRFVLPTLTQPQIREISEGLLSFDSLIRKYIQANLGFRHLVTETGSEARAIETAVKHGALRAGRPQLNPGI